jgi:hypothetical protein
MGVDWIKLAHDMEKWFERGHITQLIIIIFIYLFIYLFGLQMGLYLVAVILQ